MKKLQKRDYAGIGIGALILIVVILLVVPVGAWNPFTPKAYVKITGGIDCEVFHCWFNENVDLQYSTQGPLASTVPRLAWYCGWGAGTPPPVNAKLTVECPDYSIKTYQKSQSTCEERPVEFFFTVPLDKGVGTYYLTAEICGNTFWGYNCITKTAEIYGG